METYALDFESYYDKSCSIKQLGPLGYFSHPDFDAYLVSVVGDNGYEFAGHPKDFDWSRLDGADVLSHNASFDETLYLYGVRQGWWPECNPHAWYCTADMAACCGLPRSLKNASAQAFGIELSKSTRDSMAGKRWESMTPDFRQEVIEYAIKDARLCLQLWQEYGPKWPDFERRVSLVNRRIIQRGIPMDTDLMSSQLDCIKQQLYDAESAIPWAGEKPLLSRVAFDNECRRHGIEPPASLAQDDADAKEWMRVHGPKYRWVQAVSVWRRINALKAKLESFDCATMPDGRYYGGLMYWGSHTGRFSGSGGNLNLQNLPRNELFGVNLRNLIAPPKGRKLVVADLSQIEVRTLCWLAGDRPSLEAIAKSDDIYEAFAIRMGLWEERDEPLKKANPDLRHKVKTMVLGCGYGSGAEKFAQISHMPLEEAAECVRIYRTSLKKIPAFWRELNSCVQAAYHVGVPFVWDLPSGRKMDYGRTKLIKQNGKMQHVAMMNRNGRRLPMKLWGGVLAENLSQALARDIFADMLCRMDACGLTPILHVHDEVVLECSEEDAEDVLRTTIEIMSTPPTWIPDIPLSAEGTILDRYTK